MPEFGVLGPVVVMTDGENRTLPGKERVVLVALLLHAGRVVATDFLIDALWDAAPPPSARNTVQWHIKQLRQLLGPAIAKRIITKSPGYVIEVRPGELDLDNFTRLSERGRSASREGDWAHASALYADALALWRGDPLSDAPSEALRRGEVPRLAELRTQALEGRIEADLRSGRHDEVISELRQLTDAHPYRERTWTQLMRALYLSGRRGEALDAYQQARSALSDDLGIEPGGELQRLHQRILNSDPALEAPPGEAERAEGPTPRQLPADVRDFAGRDHEIGTLTGLLRGQDPGRPGAVMVAVLAGPGGIGKTVLAVHVAHLVAQRFPDGQLFVNLGGAPAHEVLARFLRDLGEPDTAIPAAEDERAARYRSLLANRKMLVVLDDARDTAQVRSLLPGTGGSAVLITSRGTLAGLEGACLADLTPLDHEASRALLVAMVGQGRAAADPEGTEGVLTWCGGLPLALRIAGSRLAARPNWSVGWLGTLLASEQRRLAELATGDLAVRASFEVSYRALPGSAARVFRLLGLSPSRTLGLPAISALAGRPDTASAVDALLDAHLLESAESGRFSMHDLLRIYAAERAASEETEMSQREARRRILTWYVHAVHAAVGTLGKLRQPFALAPLPAGVRVASFDGHADALAWLGGEHANVIKAVRYAADQGAYDLCHQLARLLRGYLEWSGYWSELVAVSETGLAAARSSGDETATAMLLNILGCAHWKLGQLDAAIDNLAGSLAISRETEDRELQSMALSNLGHVESDAGLPASAISRLTEALEINRGIGNRTFEGYILHNLGHVYLATGDLETALEYLRQALDIRVALHAINDQAATLHSIGEALLRLGRTDEAMELLEQALGLSRDNGMRYGEGLTLASLGDGWHALGKTDEARDLWQRAHDVLAELGAAEAESVRARLRT